MKKTIADHLGLNKKSTKQENKTFFLNDVLKNNPQLYCPFCDENEVKSVNTHNLDGYDYKCNSCQSTYEIVLGNSGDIW